MGEIGVPGEIIALSQVSDKRYTYCCIEYILHERDSNSQIYSGTDCTMPHYLMEDLIPKQILNGKLYVSLF